MAWKVSTECQETEIQWSTKFQNSEENETWNSTQNQNISYKSGSKIFSDIQFKNIIYQILYLRYLLEDTLQNLRGQEKGIFRIQTVGNPSEERWETSGQNLDTHLQEKSVHRMPGVFEYFKRRSTEFGDNM